MRAEFYRRREGGAAEEQEGSQEPEPVVAVATWTGRRVEVEADDPKAKRAVDRVFRPFPVPIDDPSLRVFGTRGEEVIAPGSLHWFMAAARVRGRVEGLEVRFVPRGGAGVGFDPAGGYRKFPEAVERGDRAPAPGAQTAGA